MITGKSLRAMRVPQADAGPRGLMGITWFIRRVGDLTIYAHGGATNGQQAYFFFIPDRKFACAILTNSDDGGIIIRREGPLDRIGSTPEIFVPEVTPSSRATQADGFDWGDAAIGAGGAFVVMLLASGAVSLTRRRGATQPTVPA